MQIGGPTGAFIVRMRHVPFIDATAVNRLREMCTKLLSKDTAIIISGANRNVKQELLQAGLYELTGKYNIHNNIREALEFAENGFTRKRGTAVTSFFSAN